MADPPRTTARIWLPCLLSLTLLAAAAVLAALTWPAPPPAPYQSPLVVLLFVPAVAGMPVLGALLGARGTNASYGTAWSAAGAGYAACWFAVSYAMYDAGPGDLPAVPLVVTAGGIGWALAITALPFTLLLFPDGRLTACCWRSLARCVVLAGALIAGLTVVSPHQGVAPIGRNWELTGLPGRIVEASLSVLGISLVTAAAVSAGSMLGRYRRGSAVTRAQIRWVAWAASVFAVSLAVGGLNLLGLPGEWNALLEAIGFLTVTGAVGIAVLRHHLFDIDLLINRTLVYTVLTACVVGVYVGIVGYSSSVLGHRASLPVTLLATGVVAVAFQPLRERVQRAVNHVLYGDRDEPHAVVARLARRLEEALEPDEVLPAVVATTASALRLPHVSIWLDEDDGLRLAACHGTAPAAPGDAAAPLTYPLQHGGELVGVLCVAPRTPGEALAPADARALTEITRHVGAAVHAVRLTTALHRSLDDLRQSRERLVTSQEQERRRIQRDLHDGLGPMLAAMRLHLEAALALPAGSPAAMPRLLERVDALAGQAGAEVRRLVHGLRPPVLDQVGLVGALNQHVTQFGRDCGLDVRFRGDDTVTVPAVAEVAVFRVAQEALTNVAKHAGATHVDVRLRREGTWLHLDVEDDGVGLPTGRNGSGTGLRGMRERAKSLGGDLKVEGFPGAGTHLTLRIPAEAT